MHVCLLAAKRSENVDPHPIESNAGRRLSGVLWHAAGRPGQDGRVRKWQRLCGELLAEREQRAELEKERLDILRKDSKLDLTREEVYAQVDRECSLDPIIADLERKVGTRA